MNESIRPVTKTVTMQRAFRVALLAILSILMLALGACQSSRSVSDRMESKYSLKKRKTSIMRLRPQGLEHCPLPVKVSEQEFRTLLESIETLKGAKYRFGGTNPEGFDCSGFVQYLYSKAFRLALPRTTNSLVLLGPMVPREQIERGDLLFFAFEDDIGHVGIYLGNQRFAHASSVAKGVTVSLLENNYANHFAFGTRIVRVQ
ncbi:MAG: C40 family peptidase [Chlorobiaceae bacterium]|nr:C40 family peptidase [Chlorobiaceae bacterium]